MTGEFGSFSNPQIDRESDLLREIERLKRRLVEARDQAEIWKERFAAVNRDFDATLQSPCPYCGERP